MVVLRLTLKKEDNPEFYTLCDEQKLLMDRWNQFNKQLHDFKIPRLCLSKSKDELCLIGVEMNKLQKDFLEWYKRAHKFYIDPSYTIEGTSEERMLVYSHFTAILGDIMHKFNSDMLMLADNYNSRYSEYNNQLNFLIAIGGLTIAVVGLIVAL